MIAAETALPEVKLIMPKRHGDARGWFSETYRADWFDAQVEAIAWLQDNHSRSAEPGTLRGLHFQTPPHAQAKLVRCVAGAIWDVAVDIRTGSPTFGQHAAAELTAENGHQLYVPAGFAHGFVTLVPDTEVIYKVSAYYAPDADAGMAWDDPALALPWPRVGAGFILSDKDTRHPPLADIGRPFVYHRA